MVDECVGNRANEAGLRASRAWLLGRSLAAEVEDVRFRGGDDPVAAPGLPKLLDRLERDLRDVLALSERIDGLLDGPERSLDLPSDRRRRAGCRRGGCRRDRTGDAAAGSAGSRGVHRPASGQACRAAGQRGRGRPPPTRRHGTAAHLADDGIELFSRDRHELEVELRGLCCRMLLDGGVTVQIGPVELAVGSDHTLRLTTPEADSSWEIPVEVSLPAVAAGAALKALGMSCKKIRRTATVY